MKAMYDNVDGSIFTNAKRITEELDRMLRFAKRHSELYGADNFQLRVSDFISHICDLNGDILKSINEATIRPLHEKSSL